TDGNFCTEDNLLRYDPGYTFRPPAGLDAQIEFPVDGFMGSNCGMVRFRDYTCNPGDPWPWCMMNIAPASACPLKLANIWELDVDFTCPMHPSNPACKYNVTQFGLGQYHDMWCDCGQGWVTNDGNKGAEWGYVPGGCDNSCGPSATGYTNGCGNSCPATCGG